MAYDTDFFEWTREQAAILRAAVTLGANVALDWSNIAEEIEALGRSERRELASRIATVIEHLLKLEFSPAREPRAGWVETIGRNRLEIDQILDDSPSLRNELGAVIARATPRVAAIVAEALVMRGEIDAAGAARVRETRFTEERIFSGSESAGGG